MVSISRLNTRLARSPVNTSLTPLRTPAHDSGPRWFATPFSYKTSTCCTSPVRPAISKTGDAGETALLSGGRVAKNDVRVEAYGNLDKLNAERCRTHGSSLLCLAAATGPGRAPPDRLPPPGSRACAGPPHHPARRRRRMLGERRRDVHHPSCAGHLSGQGELGRKGVTGTIPPQLPQDGLGQGLTHYALQATCAPRKRSNMHPGRLASASSAVT